MRTLRGKLFSTSERASFFDNEDGSFLIIFAFILPVLLLVVGGTIDYSSALRERTKLQGVADAAAILGGKDLTVAGGDIKRVKAVTEAFIEMRFGTELKKEVNVDPDLLQVEVILRKAPESFFGSTYGLAARAGVIAVRSMTQIVGDPNLCVLALDGTADSTLALEKKAKLTANGCAVFSNSVHKKGLVSSSASKLKADIICTAGGYQGGRKMFDPQPVSDCPTFDDPLTSRHMPEVPPCVTGGALVDTSQRAGFQTSQGVRGSTDPKKSGDGEGGQTLSPGAYCGGLTITDNVVVTLEKGNYFFIDGPLIVEGGATLKGTEVSLLFKGNDARLHFAEDSTIALGAPEDGQMAGILIYESRMQPGGHQFLIESDNAQYLLGTIYIPRGEFKVDGTRPVADQSEYTAIVARYVRLHRSPHLILNTNYDLTNVPVPDGIRGVGEPVVLRE